MTDTSPAPGSRRSYTIAGCALFCLIGVLTWKAHIVSHEMIYLLGSRRIFDPSFLAFDFTWSTLSPTSFLYDHLLAPLWAWLPEFTIVNLGRLVTTALAAWSIVVLARALGVSAWAAVVGCAAWLFWRQTLGTCGAPLEGFQVKSFAYPLMFFSIAHAIRKRLLLAGLCAGGATAFHIIVGGWGCLALFVSLLVNRKLFPLRGVAIFLLATAPLILPVLLAVGRFHEAGMTGEERQYMDEIYVTIAAPFCCDLDYFMNVERWQRVGVIFVLAPIVLALWPRRDAARVVAGFVATLIAAFLLAEVAQRRELYAFLKVFPCQLGASLPAFFLFLLLPAWVVQLPKVGWPKRVAGSIALLGALWLLYDRGALRYLVHAPGDFVSELRQPQWGGSPIEPEYGDKRLYHWIRTSTPPESVFITPLIKDFWPYAERAQVASRRHPPFDKRLIEWTERLQAIHELDLVGGADEDEADLTIEELVDLREDYGATHYLTRKRRDDLTPQLRFTSHGFYVYDVLELEEPEVRELSVTEVASPAGPSSAEPNLVAAADGSVLLSWIDRSASIPSVRLARRSGGSWSRPRTIVSNEKLFVNWADCPSVLPLSDGRIVAHWLQTHTKAPYAYDVRVAISPDSGVTWSAPEIPHRDGTAAEHGFVSLVDLGARGFAAIWLDGRELATNEAGATQLMLAVHDGNSFGPERVLDPRVCDCCATTAVAIPDGAFAAYRDRGADEVRDIYSLRTDARAATAPAPVHADNWKITGCPVNGPSAARSGSRIVLAWYSEIEGTPSAFVALSGDDGRSFGAPRRIDAGSPLGRVDVDWITDDTAVVVWLERDEEHGTRILARAVTVPSLAIGPEVVVARTGLERSHALPRVARASDGLIVAWTESSEPPRIRLAQLTIGSRAYDALDLEDREAE